MGKVTELKPSCVFNGQSSENAMKTGLIPAVQVVWDEQIGRIQWCRVV
jgi:hypothetical protein